MLFIRVYYAADFYAAAVTPFSPLLAYAILRYFAAIIRDREIRNKMLMAARYARRGVIAIRYGAMIRCLLFRRRIRFRHAVAPPAASSPPLLRRDFFGRRVRSACRAARRRQKIIERSSMRGRGSRQPCQRWRECCACASCYAQERRDAR